MLAGHLSGNSTINIPQACGGRAKKAADRRFFAQDRQRGRKKEQR